MLSEMLSQTRPALAGRASGWLETVKRWTNIFETMNETAAARQEAGFGCSRADASILQHASSRNLQPSELVELRANRREGPYRLKGRKRQQRQHTPAPLRVGKRQGAGGAAPSCNHAVHARASTAAAYARQTLLWSRKSNKVRH